MLMETATLNNMLLESGVLDSQWLWVIRLSPAHRCVSCVLGPHVLSSSLCNEESSKVACYHVSTNLAVNWGTARPRDWHTERQHGPELFHSQIRSNCR